MPDEQVKLAEAVIPVKADLDEFNRQLEETLRSLEQKLAEAAERAARGFTEKIGGALDDIIAQITRAEELARRIESPSAPAVQQEQPKPASDELGRKVDAIAAQLNEVNNNLTLIVTKTGNN